MTLMEVSFGGLYEPHGGFIWRFLCTSWRIHLEDFMSLMADSFGGFYDPHGGFIWRFV